MIQNAPTRDQNVTEPGELLPAKLEIKDQIAIVLKEYDAHRSEIEHAYTLMQSIGISLGLIFAGAAISWKGEFSPQLILVVAPILFMATAAVITNLNFGLEICAVWLAGLENHIFAISGLPLLSHSTKLVMRRRKHAGRLWMAWFGTVTAAYVALEVVLYLKFRLELFSKVIGGERFWTAILFSAILAPCLYLWFFIIATIRKRAAILMTPLAETLGLEA